MHDIAHHIDNLLTTSGRSILKNKEQHLMGCWQQCLQREVIIPTYLVRDEDEVGNIAAQPLGRGRGNFEVEDMLLEDGEQSTLIGPCNAVEDDIEEDNPVGLVVDLRLIGGDQTIEFDDDDLLEILESKLGHKSSGRSHNLM
ncbi:hypothetical protein ACROYT_G018841 [Oculina patagonica]